uniref:Lipocalin n=1 Tax=Rhipicephalus appendiculatus TaxID=34631 RepID=A0A131YV28_RHIAP
MMALLLVMWLFTCDFPPIMASCPEKQEPGACNGGDFLPQMYCGDVFIQVDKWTCTRKNKERCVCTIPLHRDIDGECVSKEKCKRRWEIGKPNDVTPHTKPPPIPDDKKPDNAKGSSDAAKFRQFIQTERTMYLMMAIRDDLPGILADYHVCMKSAYITTTSRGAYRTLNNYRIVRLVGDYISMTTKQGAAEFRVLRVEDGPLKMKLILDSNESSHYGLQQTFTVLHVEETCLLLSYGRPVAHAPTDDQKQTNKNNVLGNPPHKEISTESVINFLQKAETIHLQKVWQDDWFDTDCECVESVFMVNTLNGSERTLGCYSYTEIRVPSVTKKRAIWQKKLVKIEEKADFRAVTKDGITTVYVEAILGLSPTQDPSTDVFRGYVVLEVDTDCLLLSYGKSKDGELKCLLWGLSRNTVKTDTTCHKQMDVMCADDMYDITESKNPCDYYGGDEE